LSGDASIPGIKCDGANAICSKYNENQLFEYKQKITDILDTRNTEKQLFDLFNRHVFENLVNEPNHEALKYLLHNGWRETKEKFRMIEEQLSDEVYEGVYYPQRLYYKLIQESFREITPDGTFYWECRENDEIIFENRTEALRFKKAFVDAVNGRNNFGNSRWCPNLNESLKKFLWVNGYKNIIVIQNYMIK
jgi:hypothetical protein